MSLRFFDAFAGIGGFRLGLERAGHTCVGGAEIDKFARGIYEHRFGRSETHHGDIRAVDPAGLPDFEILCGGFPCQAFSVAGRRGGFSDTRGTLFFEIARIAAAKAPRYLFLENVKGLLSHDQGWTFWTILRTLDELGYDAEWGVLNSRDHGVPQNRERVFIVGRSRTHRGREVFPLRAVEGWNPEAHAAPSGEGQRLQDERGPVASTVRPGARSARNSTVVSCLDANYYKGGPRQLVELTDAGTGDAQRVYDADGQARTLKSTSGGQGAPTGLYLIRKNMNGPDRVEREGKWLPCDDVSPTLMSKEDYNARVLYKQGFGADANMKEGDIVPPLKASDAKYGDSSPMILHRNQRGEVRASDESGAVQTTMHGNNTPKLFMEARIRRLTPRECERLQGFPDYWTTEGIFNGKVKKISDTQRYRCLGNAVTVNVIEEIAKGLY